MEIEDYRMRLRKKRRYSNITFDVRRFSDNYLMTQEAAHHPWVIVDDYVREFGFTGLGSDWIQINLKEGNRLLKSILRFSLVYTNEEILPETEADRFTVDFFQFFESVPRVFTNDRLGRMYQHTDTRISGKRSPYYDVNRGGGSLSESTFDTGVVAMSNETLGILWIEEED